MTDTILAVIITGTISVITTILSNSAAKDNFRIELNKNISVVQEQIKNMQCDIKEHNNYAKMFSETMPVIKEQIREIYKRLDRLENKE